MAALVQSAEGQLSKGSTVTAILGSPPTSGNILVAMVAENNTSLLTSLTAGAGKAYSSVATPSNTGIQLYATYRIADGGESATTTGGFSGPVQAWLWVGEFSGVDTFQSVATNTGSGGAITMGTDGDASTALDVGCVADSDSSAAFTGPNPSGYILDDQGTGTPSYCVTYDLDRGASNNPSITAIGNSNWAAAHMTFELASSTPGGAAINHYSKMRRR